ncbi:MAG: hypothetical protein ACLSCO_01390 [Gallintestinimicrobium sp.]
MIANIKAAGHLLGIDALKNINATYTGNLRAGAKAAGFQVLTESKYLTGPDYLLAGDILLNDSHHTATNVQDGAKAGGSEQPAQDLRAADPEQLLEGIARPPIVKKRPAVVE